MRIGPAPRQRPGIAADAAALFEAVRATCGMANVIKAMSEKAGAKHINPMGMALGKNSEAAEKAKC